MKYLNTAQPMFDDTVGTFKFTDGCISCLTNNTTVTGTVRQSSNADVLWVKFDFRDWGFTNSVSVTAFEMRLDNGKYIDIYYNGSLENLSLELSGSKISSTYTYNQSVWYPIYLKVDFTEGTIDFYLNNVLRETIINANIKNAKMSYFVFRTRKSGTSAYNAIRNIIVSDTEIKPTEILMEIPTSLHSTEWTDNGDGTYSTDETNKQIKFNLEVDKTLFESKYYIKDTNIVFPTTQSSETQNTVIVNGTTMTLSNIGTASFGRINNVALDDKITVTS